MNWFEGSIQNAVAMSKAKNAIFVVYIEGTDENSQNMSKMINSSAASAKLNSQKFVAVKLEAGSESYNQFVQIYQLVPVPAIFFIGKNGAPIEIVPQRLEDEEFALKIDTIIAKSGLNIDTVSENMVTSESNSKTSEQTTPQAASSSQAPIVNTATVSIENSPMQDLPKSDTEKVLTPEEKIKHAEQLVKDIQHAKQLEEEETQRKKEIERRKMGQEIQKMRRKIQDDELKQIKEERLREKNEDLAAREKILKQIEQDKADRNRKFAAQNKTPEAPVTVTPPTRVVPTRDSNTARLQFRLPNGTSHNHDFPATNTLEDVRNYLHEYLGATYRQFDLATTFPRRQFAAIDDGVTVADLGLTPNAVVLVLPIASAVSQRASSVGNMFSMVLWLFLSPVYGIVGYLRNSYNNWRNPRPTPYKRPEPGTSNNSNSTSDRIKKRFPDSTVVKRQGNVHRLTDRKDDDSDDNNTWNGNSTQQM